VEFSWKAIFSIIWDKIAGSGKRASDLNIQTELVIREWKGLYEEKKSLLKDFEKQKKIIDEYRIRHPDNGEELNAWEKRELELMLKLTQAHEEIHFWKEQALFHEKENEFLHSKIESKK